MPMSKAKKQVMLTEFEKTLAEAKGIVFANYHGVKVADLERLRRQLHQGGMSFRVTKNRLMRIALERNNLVIDQTILDQPIAMAASDVEELAPAQALKAFQKQAETIKVVGGLVNGQFLTANEVLRLADLPSRDILRAQVVGVLAGPLVGLLRGLQAPLVGLVSVLKQYETQRGSN